MFAAVGGVLLIACVNLADRSAQPGQLRSSDPTAIGWPARKSAAGMRRRPSGWTSSNRRAAAPVAIVRPLRSAASTVPGAALPSTRAVARTFSAPPSGSAQIAPGQG